MKHKPFQVVSIIFTEKCNLGCKYCYVIEENVGHHNQKMITMPRDVMDQAIEFIRNEVAPYVDSLRIDLYGGECMLVPEELKYFVDKFFVENDSIMDKTQLLIFTNGTTMTEDIMKWALQYHPKLDFSFSVDGAAPTQNASRPFKDGSPSHDKIVENFELYKKIYNIPDDDYSRFVYSRSVHTISPHNLPYFMDTLREYKRIGLKRYHTFLAKDDIWTPEDVQMYREVREESVDFLIKEFPVSGIMDVHMKMCINRRLNKSRGQCSSGKTLLSITQNGDIYPCHRLYEGSRAEKFIIGNVWEGFDDTALYAGTLEGLTIDKISGCSTCKYGIRDWCESQCTSACFESNGSPFKIIDSVCQLLKAEDDAAWRLYQTLKSNQDFINSLQSG